jgi:hypothetical protein
MKKRKLPLLAALLVMAVAVIGFTAGTAAATTTTIGNVTCDTGQYNPTHFAIQVGQTVTCTITGTDVPDGPVNVNIQSSNFGNTTVIGTASGGTITFSYTGADNGCDTANITFDNPDTGGVENTHTGFGFVDSSGNHLVCGTRPPAADLTVSKNASGSYDDTFEWTIDKSVDNTKVFTAGGSEATVSYTVTVSHGDSQVSNVKVTGTITVTNPNVDASNNPVPVDITGVTDQLSDGTDCTVTDGGAQTISGASAQFAYSCDLPGLPNGSLTNTATVSWDKQDLSNGTTLAAGSADFTTPSAITFTAKEIDTCVIVDDTNPNGPQDQKVCVGGDNPTTFKYSDTLKDPAGTCTSHDNTASFTTNDTETTGSASQTVTDCQGADLTVSKTATPSFTRTYAWDIKKDVDKTKVTLNGGQATFNYTVTVHHDAGTDSGWAVKGQITITNPNDWEDITLTNLSDALDASGACTLDTPGPYVVPKSDSLTVDYTCANASALDTKNTATAEWDKDAAHTPNGSASGDAAVAFTTPTTVTDECVSVSDPIDPNSPHTFCVGDAGDPTFSFQYSRTVNAPPLGSCQSYDNTATFTTNDSGKTGSASQTVTVCNFNAPLTIGYWKNHLGKSSNPNDCQGLTLPSGTSCSSNGPWVKQYLPQSLGTYSVDTILKAAKIFAGNNCSNASTSNANAISCLAAQLLAAELNIANQSDPSCISATITAANNFLTAIGYNGAGTGTLDATHTRAQAIALKTALDNYNNFGC